MKKLIQILAMGLFGASAFAGTVTVNGSGALTSPSAATFYSANPPAVDLSNYPTLDGDNQFTGDNDFEPVSGKHFQINDVQSGFSMASVSGSIQGNGGANLIDFTNGVVLLVDSNTNFKIDSNNGLILNNQSTLDLTNQYFSADGGTSGINLFAQKVGGSTYYLDWASGYISGAFLNNAPIGDLTNPIPGNPALFGYRGDNSLGYIEVFTSHGLFFDGDGLDINQAGEGQLGTVALAPSATDADDTSNAITPFALLDAGFKPYKTSMNTIAAGTAYTLTASYASVDFGTTDPFIIFDVSGDYYLYVNLQTSFTTATTVAGQSVSAKLRRTNNTAADIGTSRGQPLPVMTLTSSLGPEIVIGPFPYTATAGDIVTVQAILSTVLSAGSATVTACEITAVPR